jgi:hypothetical protein
MNDLICSSMHIYLGCMDADRLTEDSSLA